MREKFKNYGLWVAIASLGLLFVQDFGIAITPEKYNVYVNTILGILVLLGVISNPNSGSGFEDDEEDKEEEV
jgi:uncharacterized membrane protein